MYNTLDEAISDGFAKRDGSWYYSKDGVRLAQKKEAALEKLNTLLSTGSEPSGSKLETLETTPEKKSKTHTDELYGNLLQNLGDISKFRGGVSWLDIFVHGISVLVYEHPTIRKCPIVFAWKDAGKDKGKIVKSGNRLENQGWTVLSKKDIIDPRTGSRWITVNRDDTPNEDYIMVDSLVLCYADKAQFHELEAEETMKNMTRSADMIKSRKENAKKMAKLSEVDPAGSAKGYSDANQRDKDTVSEFLAMENKFVAGDVKHVEQNLDALRQKVESGAYSPDLKTTTIDL